MNFFDRLSLAIARNQSLLYVGLEPNPERWPECYEGQHPDFGRRVAELEEWLVGLVAETADFVCAYRVNPEFYQVMGAVGLELLERVLAAVPDHIPVILDAKHSDLNSSTIVAQRVFGGWQVDAVTLNAYAGQDLVAPFLVYADRAIFVLCTTTNPSAQVLQGYGSAETPFYLHLAKEAKTWGPLEQVGLEVGAATPDVLAAVRSVAPERVIMARSVWTEGSDLASILSAGLNANGNGLLIPVSPEILVEPKRMEQIQGLRDQVNQARTQRLQNSPNCAVWTPDVCLLNQPPHEDLILQLYDIGCLQFGDHVQASGATFPYYIDLRRIISNPQVFDKVISAYAEILQNLKFDRIAGIPYGALPTATGLSLRLSTPMIFPRKEVKAHGARRLVEGNFYPGETAVVVDDIFITGNSAIEGAQKLQSVGLEVQDIVVLIDHEKGVKDKLAAQGYQGHAVLTLSAIAKTLHEAGRINDTQLLALGEA